MPGWRVCDRCSGSSVVREMQTSFGERPGFKGSNDFAPSTFPVQSGFGVVGSAGGFANVPPSSPGSLPRPSSPRRDRVDWERHAALPLIVTGYIQALFNLVVVVGVLMAVYWFASAIQQDIDLKSEGFRREVMSEIQSCAREYTTNRCEPSERIPAMQKMCESWKNCMQQDPFTVARGKISAHTLAEIFNSFVEPISYKTMVFVCLILITVIVGSNIGFGIGRRTLAAPGGGGGGQVVVYKTKQQ